jgi:MFS transporter, MCT family, solute carrier family 16 (monocarboxylic acid transporters), member 10
LSILGATNDASSLVVTILFGFLSSGFNAVLGPVFAKLSKSVLELGHRMGIAFFLMGIATLISLPSQGSLAGELPHYIWWRPIFFVTLMIALGAVCLVLSRALLLKRQRVHKTVFGIVVV